MTTRVRATLAGRWMLGERNQLELLTLAAFGTGDAITDVTGQVNPAALATNILIVEVRVAPALATAINSLISGNPSAPMVLLANETYDDVTGEVSSGNYDQPPTGTQLTAFGTQLLARFPGLTAAQLQQGG